MLVPDSSCKSSQYSGLYDLNIPEDNILRRLNDLIDFCLFSWAYDHKEGNTRENEYWQKAKQRYKIEAENAEPNNAHSSYRASSYGLANMNLQAAITVFAVNLKRILKLI